MRSHLEADGSTGPAGESLGPDHSDDHSDDHDTVVGPEPAPSKKGPARLVLHARIAEQVQALELLGPVLREGGDDGVHRLRKICRRLRAALATYRPLLDRDVTDPIRAELRWLARSLGATRDAEVVTARLEALLDGQDEGLVVGPVGTRLDRRRARILAEQRRVVSDILSSERYDLLRSSLDRLVEAAPWTPLAEEPAREVLPRQVRREWRRLRRIHRDAEDPHELRRAAKRMRYAYETLEPVWPRATERARRAATELTEVLGERQDTVVARAVLVELAREATTTGESAFTYGRLHALEEDRERELLDEAERVWRRLKKRRW